MLVWRINNKRIIDIEGTRTIYLVYIIISEPIHLFSKDQS